MKCCWRSVAVTNDLMDTSYELDSVDIDNEEIYLSILNPNLVKRFMFMKHVTLKRKLIE